MDMIYFQYEKIKFGIKELNSNYLVENQKLYLHYFVCNTFSIDMKR